VSRPSWLTVFSLFKRPQNFRLFISSHSENEPPDRWFGSLKAALRAFNRLEEDLKPYAWIIEYHDAPMVGGIQVSRNVIHIKHGQRISETPE
jgi:hypothetical protein